ncbi:DNA-binding protein [Shewanella intestini]|uniref:DNA-binding protein n=1 Tax=Shewanella intestini TaxID=2017544 RepID=A0ABS5HZV3_9GAMM|nr:MULTISPECIES: DNA-binding protein [Shewanella]MBR9727312.1 DNA-binding protein [Shewanella intestini]MRG35638.1 DNA-binding protein [Shewanella sp. XMDDZSB0408]
MKNWLICIDDTDDLGTKGTGEIADEIRQLLELASEYGELKPSTQFVTRHQLYVHPDIPYTSHNSAMCFRLCSDINLDAIKQICVEHLMKECAPASDPGLAILDLSTDYDIEKLITFGLQAKKQVLTKPEAYSLATELGIDLSEHGGTGQGVIGALAGLGLRLSGNDGRVKGQITLKSENVSQGESDSDVTTLTVADVLEQTQLQAVVATTGEQVNSDEVINFTGKIKAVYINHQFTLLVSKDNGIWCNATRQQLKPY